MSFIIGKWCIQECIHNLQCSAHTNDTCSHTKNIGIIMLSCSFRHKAVCTVGCSDSLITVGCNCNTNACTADQNTFFTFTYKNCFCYLFGIIRIVTGICGISTVILIFQAVLLQIFLHFLHQFITTMITSKCYHFLILLCYIYCPNTLCPCLRVSG